MSTHEKNKQPKPKYQPTAYDLLETPDGAMNHLDHVETLLVMMRLALQALQDEVPCADLNYLYSAVLLAEEEMEAGVGKMTTALRGVKAKA